MDLQLANGAGTMSVSDNIFAVSFRESLVHQAVVAYLAGGRAGTKAQKTRAEVRGGGAKPWRQKGTGRARAGTICSPLWRKGGQIFANKPRDFSQKLNKKMYRSALRAIFSELVRQDRLVVVDAFSLDTPKTKAVLAKLAAFGGSNAFIVKQTLDNNLVLATRNVHDCEVASVSGINPVSLIGHEKVIITQNAVEQIQEWLA